MKQVKRVGALVFVPLFFMLFGYAVIYLIGAPVIHFATSAVELILLNDAPSFETKTTNLLTDLKKNKQQEDIHGSLLSPSTNEIPSSHLQYPMVGDQYGEISIAKVQMNEPLFYGDSDDILRMGAGQYIGSMIPGELGTTLIGGHNYPSFGKIYYLEAGDEIQIRTHYGSYVYRVKEVKVAQYKDPLVKEKLADRSGRFLLLYTCYPLDAIGLTSERVFVLADYVSGPMIDGLS